MKNATIFCNDSHLITFAFHCFKKREVADGDTTFGNLVVTYSVLCSFALEKAQEASIQSPDCRLPFRGNRVLLNEHVLMESLQQDLFATTRGISK